MPLSGLYTVEHSERDMTGKRLTALIRLNPFHEIFRGHFPGNPVLPGVCIVQILKEMLVDQPGSNLVFNKLGSVKFFSAINPERDRLLNFDIELKETAGGGTSFNSGICFGSVVYCRLRGDFRLSTPG